jgi:hypothetical protein
MLSPPRDVFEFRAGERALKLARRGRLQNLGAPDVDGADDFAAQLRAQMADEHFDFREFGHGQAAGSG